jgi:hypothetical protein
MDSDAAEKQKQDHDQKDKPHSSGWEVTPVSAMRPSRQRPEKRKNEDHDQDSSKHLLLLPSRYSGKNIQAVFLASHPLLIGVPEFI